MRLFLYLGNIREIPCWADYEQNMAQNMYWKNGVNQSVRSNPRLRIEASWYVGWPYHRIRIEPPRAFDCRKRAMCNRIRNLKNLAIGTLRIHADFPDCQYITVSVICQVWNLSKSSLWPQNRYYRLTCFTHVELQTLVCSIYFFASDAVSAASYPACFASLKKI